MDAATARDIAEALHRGQRDRFGEPVIAHLARVAALVPPEAGVTAWLHDVLELGDDGCRELAGHDLTDDEREALALLTREPSEAYTSYAARIADAEGEAGRLARLVKLADLDDHLSHPSIPAGAPPYRWARERIAAAQARDGR